MAGLPTVQVLLDDGTGTFPYDVTTKVRMVEGISINGGRQDEQAQIQPSVCTLTFDNTDGRFTINSTIIASPSPIVINQRIRVKLTVGGTTVDRFTGYVQEWPVVWPQGGQEFSTVAITASDALARLGRIPPRTPLAEAMLLDGATLVWPLTEPEPKIAPGMTGPACYPLGPDAQTVGPLQLLGLTSTYPDDWPTFGAEQMPNGNGSGVMFPVGTTFPAPYYLGQITGGTTDTATGPGSAMTADFSIECAFKVAPGGSVNLMQIGDKLSPSVQALLLFTGSGRLGVVLYTGGTFTPGVDTTSVDAQIGIDDDEWHFATITLTNGGKTVTLMADRQLLGSSTLSTAPTANLDAVKFGRGAAVAAGAGSHLAFYPAAVTLAEHQLHYDVAIGETGFRSDEVISRYADVAGLAFTAAEDGAQTVPTFTSGDIASLMTEVMDAERGRLFVDGSGTLRFEARTHPLPDVYAGTPDITGTNDLLNPDASFPVDTQRLINRATVSRPDGAPVTAEDTASIAQHGVYDPGGISVQVMDDSQAGNLAAYLVWRNAEPGPRLAGAKIDLLTQTSAIQQAFLVQLMGAWLQLTGLPSQSPTGATANLYIEGFNELISATEWSLGINTSPKLETATTWWRLNDANFPLGTNTHPFY